MSGKNQGILRWMINGNPEYSMKYKRSCCTGNMEMQKTGKELR